MLVSEIAKNAEAMSSTNNATKSVINGMSAMVVSCLAPEKDFENELASDVSEHERGEARERPAHRDAAAPAVGVPAGEQRGEDQPRDDAEDRLVRERRGLAEKLLGEHDAAYEREREQDEARPDDAKEQCFHRE